MTVIYPPQCKNYTPRDFNPNVHGSDASMGSNRLWIRTLDRYTRASLPETWVSRMSRPPPDRTQGRIQKLKFLTPPGIESGPPGWKAETTDHAMATANFITKNLKTNEVVIYVKYVIALYLKML